MENVNIKIEARTAKKLDEALTNGLILGTLECIKGNGKDADIWFIKCIPATKSAVVHSNIILPSDASISRELVPGSELYKEGQAEEIESQIPLPDGFGKKKKGKGQIVSDPNRPSIASHVDLIVENNKAANLKSKALLDKCVADIQAWCKEKKLPADVETACINYLSQKI